MTSFTPLHSHIPSQLQIGERHFLFFFCDLQDWNRKSFMIFAFLFNYCLPLTFIIFFYTKIVKVVNYLVSYSFSPLSLSLSLSLYDCFYISIYLYIYLCNTCVLCRL